jgi:hypothetical protein
LFLDIAEGLCAGSHNNAAETCFFEELLKERAGDILDELKKLERPLNIFFLGTDEMQDRSGTLQALEKLGNLTYFTQPVGSYGQSYPGPLKECAEANSRRLWNMLQQLEAKGKSPDILIGQSRGGLIDASILLL